LFKFLNLTLLLFLSGCATTYLPIPADYKGPTAYVVDSASSEDSTRARLFYLVSIEGNVIPNAGGATYSDNQGRGFRISPSTVGRRIQARPQKVVLRGTHAMGAPIHELGARAAGTFFSVSGEIEFSPEPDGQYVVKGELKKEGSSVWIEDANSGRVVGEKVVEKR
jgi:hypothetical protein